MKKKADWQSESTMFFHLRTRPSLYACVGLRVLVRVCVVPGVMIML